MKLLGERTNVLRECVSTVTRHCEPGVEGKFLKIDRQLTRINKKSLDYTRTGGFI